MYGSRETQHTGIAHQTIGTWPFNLPSPHTQYASTASMMAVAIHHPHLDTLPSLPFPFSGQVQWAATKSWPQRCSWQLYAMVAQMLWSLVDISISCMSVVSGVQTCIGDEVR